MLRFPPHKTDRGAHVEEELEKFDSKDDRLNDENTFGIAQSGIRLSRCHPNRGRASCTFDALEKLIK